MCFFSHISFPLLKIKLSIITSKNIIYFCLITYFKLSSSLKKQIAYLLYNIVLESSGISSPNKQHTGKISI